METFVALAGAGAKGKKKAKMHKKCVGFGHQQVIDAMNIGHWFIHVLHIFITCKVRNGL
jgi:hypothetical protein